MVFPILLQKVNWFDYTFARILSAMWGMLEQTWANLLLLLSQQLTIERLESANTIWSKETKSACDDTVRNERIFLLFVSVLQRMKNGIHYNLKCVFWITIHFIQITQHLRWNSFHRKYMILNYDGFHRKCRAYAMESIPSEIHSKCILWITIHRGNTTSLYQTLGFQVCCRTSHPLY